MQYMPRRFSVCTEVYGVCVFATAACLGHTSVRCTGKDLRHVCHKGHAMLRALLCAYISQTNLPTGAIAQASADATIGAAADAVCVTGQTAHHCWQHTKD